MRTVSTGTEWERKVGYSRAVRAGDLIFVTGTVALDPGGTPHAPGDPHAQARRCLEIIEDAIRQLGGAMTDVVRTRIYVTDIADFEHIARAHSAVFADHRPCTTMVEVSALVRPEFVVEIEADAVVNA